MHFNKWLVGAACVLLLIAVVAVTWLHAATATVGAVTATPAYVVVNTPTPVVITVQIADPTLIANGVNLLKVDSTGKTLATIGIMHDDGGNGDAKAGDKTFSYRINVSEPAVGQAYYRASAAFKGILQRSLSTAIVVTVDPFALPPDPGEGGKQTLGGVDLDRDGVRDDVQRYIAYAYGSSPRIRFSLLQYAGDIQAFLVGDSSITDQSAQAARLLSSMRCVSATASAARASTLTADVLAETLNTPLRSRAFIQSQRNFGGVTIPVLPSKDTRDIHECRFDVNAIPQ